MRLLDTDIMVDLLREHLPAIEWLRNLPQDEEVGLPGFMALELMGGCQDKQEMVRVQKILELYRIYWPTDTDCNRALATFAQGRLSHHVSILDVLIGECAVGLDVSLCTFNVKHFNAVRNLTTEQPYEKSDVRNTL